MMTGPDAHPRAFIAGKPAEFQAAANAAARLLETARLPVVALDGTDDAGTRAALDLAFRLKGAVGHLSMPTASRDLDAMRGPGWIVTTPLQTRARADHVMIVGEIPNQLWPSMSDDLALDRAPTLFPDMQRSLVRLSGDGILRKLAALRAIVKERRTSLPGTESKPLAALAASCRCAKYGVAIWSAESLDAMSIEVLAGLIDDLNAHTRFSGLPVGTGGNVEGSIQAFAAVTGFPGPVSFAPGNAIYDPWRFDPRRMIESGEADAALYVCTLHDAHSAPPGTIPTVALVTEPAAATAADVGFVVGRPGDDHSAFLHDRRVGGLVHIAGTAKAGVVSASVALAAIATALTEMPVAC